jgi:hypothetical protein
MLCFIDINLSIANFSFSSFKVKIFFEVLALLESLNNTLSTDIMSLVTAGKHH